MAAKKISSDPHYVNKYKVLAEFKYIVENEEVNAIVGQEIEMEADIAAPLVEAGSLEMVAPEQAENAQEEEKDEQAETAPYEGPTGLVVEDMPTKLEYAVGETMDLSGLVVMDISPNGEKSQQMVAAENVSGFDTSVAAEKVPVTITFGEKTCSFDISVK